MTQKQFSGRTTLKQTLWVRVEIHPSYMRLTTRKEKLLFSCSPPEGQETENTEGKASAGAPLTTGAEASLEPQRKTNYLLHPAKRPMFGCISSHTLPILVSITLSYLHCMRTEVWEVGQNNSSVVSKTGFNSKSWVRLASKSSLAIPTSGFSCKQQHPLPWQFLRITTFHQLNLLL